MQYIPLLLLWNITIVIVYNIHNMGLFNNNKDCFTVTLPFYGIFDYSQLEVVDGPKIYSTTEGIKYTYKVKFKKL